MASFFATIMVVYRHSLNYLAFFNSCSGEGLNGWVQDGFMRLTQVAVPYFFIISGFFFFRKNYYLHGKWLDMLEVKFYSLFMPFVIWNAIGLFTLIITHQDFSLSMHDFLMSEWYGPLWYVRDLMTYMLLVPLYQWLFMPHIRPLSKYSVKLALIGVLFILVYRWTPVDTQWMSSEGMLYFALGGILQNYSNLLNRRLPKYLLLASSLLWLLLSFHTWHFTILHKLNIIVGIISFWGVLDYIKNKEIDKLLSYSFFIYVLHFYLIKIMKVGLAKVFYGNDFMALLAYLVLPILCSVLIIVLAKIIQKNLPNFYKIATGDR